MSEDVYGSAGADTDIRNLYRFDTCQGSHHISELCANTGLVWEVGAGKEDRRLRIF